jgi:CHAT domain-containing protein
MSAHRLSAEESRGAVSLARNYVRLLSSKDITAADVSSAGRRLYRALIGDSGEAAVAGLKNLIIIPDRSLYDLPFEALVPGRAPAAGMDRMHFLMEDFGITYAPSASTLVSILGREGRLEPGGDLLSIGDPSIDPGKPGGRSGRGDDILLEYYLDNRFVLRRLEFASREMESISRLIAPARRRIVSGSEATEGKVKSLPLSGYKVLHFATHSLLDEKVASRSALVLTPDPLSSEDGFLQAGEIYSLDLNADLVVLSACQTAGGKMEKGEGIQGLARAFFCAGSKSVVASLWNVNDRSTSRFMKDFYAYLTAGKTKQEALRLTKVKMSRSGEWRPCHWAAFVLVGEGGAGVGLHRAPFWGRVPHL